MSPMLVLADIDIKLNLVIYGVSDERYGFCTSDFLTWDSLKSAGG